MTSEAAPAAAKSFPVSSDDLVKFSNEACDAALKDVKFYEHEEVRKWTSKIIDALIASLIKSTTPDEIPEGKKPQPPYRFCINCTIIQQDVDEEDKPGSAGKRGMHSAAGAYWDGTRDGMWTYKYQGAEDRGIEVVLHIAWFSTY